MYNLLVSSQEDEWDGQHSMLDEPRFLEHTDDSIRDRFRAMDEAAISELKSFPTIFAYEEAVGKPARVGRITTIRVRQAQIRITYEFDPSIPEISAEQMLISAWEFDLNRFEMNRTHWAVKDVDLSEALRDSGIHNGAVIAPDKEVVFSRGSILKAAGLLQEIGHTSFDSMLLEFEIHGLYAGRDQGSLLSRSNALAEFAVHNPASVTAEGENVGDAIVRNAIEKTWLIAQYPEFEITDPAQLAFIRSLEKDGFTISGGQLQVTKGTATTGSSQAADTEQPAPIATPEIAVESASQVVTNAPFEGSYKVLPTVFHKPSDAVQPDLVSIMMPFDHAFNIVHASIQEACRAAGLTGIRVDDVWEDSTVIQDVFSLIYRSTIVIVDFTDQNPNVFYETGIAHTLGKLVVPIAQSETDVPFDLRHHRYLKYHPNTEGLGDLATKLESRLKTLINVLRQ